MAKLAVDCVLLPDEDVTNFAIRLNRRLPEHAGQIWLNKINCFPHISLCMGCLDERQIGMARERLEEVASDWSELRLNIRGLVAKESTSGKIVSSLEIAASNELQRLHEGVMGQLEPLLGHNCSGINFAGGQASESSLEWVNLYHKEHSFENFVPHITIGYGEVDDCEIPESFIADTIALFLLGDNCTCHRLLLSFKLGAAAKM